MINLASLIQLPKRWHAKDWESKRELKTAYLVEMDKLRKWFKQQDIHPYSPRFNVYCHHLTQEYIEACIQQGWVTRPDLRHIKITTILIF